jgi:hypothetical protein
MRHLLTVWPQPPDTTGVWGREEAYEGPGQGGPLLVVDPEFNGEREGFDEDDRLTKEDLLEKMLQKDPTTLKGDARNKLMIKWQFLIEHILPSISYRNVYKGAKMRQGTESITSQTQAGELALATAILHRWVPHWAEQRGKSTEAHGKKTPGSGKQKGQPALRSGLAIDEHYGYRNHFNELLERPKNENTLRRWGECYAKWAKPKSDEAERNGKNKRKAGPSENSSNKKRSSIVPGAQLFSL